MTHFVPPSATLYQSVVVTSNSADTVTNPSSILKGNNSCSCCSVCCDSCSSQTGLGHRSSDHDESCFSCAKCCCGSNSLSQSATGFSGSVISWKDHHEDDTRVVGRFSASNRSLSRLSSLRTISKEEPAKKQQKQVNLKLEETTD